jgi:sulfoxide reductase heme-binding subunit YedZ
MIELKSIAGVVRDPAGRLSWLKILVLVLVLLPGLSTALDWVGHDLGPRPVTEAIHATGLWAIRFLVITLAVTPTRGVLDFSRVVMLRRMLGVTSACYATAHFTLFIVDQHWNLYKVLIEILSRFYLTIGYVAFLGLLALAITSTDAWQKSLGRDWKKLHKLVFVIGPLVLFHYAVQSKADISDAVFLTGLFLWLMFWRLVPRRLQTKLWPLPAFALGAGLLAALMEAAWYMVRNGVNGWMVLDANLDISYGPRPAVAAAIVGFGVLAVAAARKLLKRRRVPSGVARQARPCRAKHVLEHSLRRPHRPANENPEARPC